jgi:2-oxoglutarate ferredoxin oxidoreductase subunit alpha
VLSRFRKVLVPEMNLGQLALLLRARYLKDIVSLTKVQGRPFTRLEIDQKIREILEPSSHVH